MKTWPLRRKIASWSALATAVALLTFAGVVAFNLYFEQIEMIDTRLAGTASLVIAQRTASTSLDLAMLDALTLPAKHRHRVSLFGFVLVRTNDGAILRAQPVELGAVAKRWPLPRRFFSWALDRTRLRCGGFQVGDTTLLLAAPLEPADESIRDLLGAALIAIPLVLVVVAGGSWWIARRALRPITEITRAAELITTRNLSARLPGQETDDEIGAHVRVLNEMFDRLQRGFEQTARFTADAAHELRTPLTILRGQLEDALHAEDLPSEHEQLLVGLLDETTGLQRISDNLLLLARFDSGKDGLKYEPLSLSILLDDANEDAELLATPNGIAIIADITPGIYVAGDATMLRRVALNLIDNAIKFNRPAGNVRMTLRAEEADAVFIIGNTGPGIPPERLKGLFERFYRSLSGLNRDAGGSGLGLSLCREIVTAHGGTILVSCSDADWMEFTVRLQRIQPTTDSSIL